MRIEQGVPNTRKPPTRKQQVLTDLSAQHFRDMIKSVEEERESRRRTIELLERILEKLEEIRYGIADNETGVSNLLRQMKITNARLDELIDKRSPSFDKD